MPNKKATHERVAFYQFGVFQLLEFFKAFIAKYKKEAFGTFRPPVAIVAQEGIPKEIIAAIDIERIVLDSCNQMYMFLESIGFYRVPSMLIHEMGYGTKFGDFISPNNRETPKVA